MSHQQDYAITDLVTTPPAKAWRLLMTTLSLRGACVMKAASQPKFQNILSSVSITISGVATERTAVDTILQGFLDLWELSACATALGRVVGRNCDDLNASTFRLAAQNREECSPSHIIGRFCQSGFANARYVEVLVSNHAMFLDQRTGGFVMKVTPFVGNVLMLFLKEPDRFLAPVRSLLAPCYLALCASEGLLCLAVVLGRLDFLPFMSDKEGLEAQVNANGRIGGRLNFALTQVTGEHDVPIPCFSFEGDGFNHPIPLSMPFDLEQADILDVESALILNLAPITIGREFDAIKASLPLKSRVAWLLPVLETAEERGKGFVETAKGGLATGKVGLLQVGIGEPFLLEVSRLHAVIHRTLILFPCIFPFRKRTVVEATMRFHQGLKPLCLLFVGIQAVLVRFSHLLTSCLL